AGAAPDATQPLVQPQASSSAAAGQQQQQPTPGSPPRGLTRFLSTGQDQAPPERKGLFGLFRSNTTAAQAGAAPPDAQQFIQQQQQQPGVTVLPSPSGLCYKAPPSLDEVAKPGPGAAQAHPTRVPPPTPSATTTTTTTTTITTTTTTTIITSLLRHSTRHLCHNGSRPAVDPNFSGPPPLEEKFGPYLRFGGYETTTRVYSASVMMVIHQTRSPHPPHLRYRGPPPLEEKFGPYLRFGGYETTTRVYSASVMMVIHQTRSPHPPHLRYRDVHNGGSELVLKTPLLLWSYAGYNFWRWDLHVQLGLTPSSIEYAVVCSADHPFTAHTRYRFELPAAGQTWHWGFHSCNGFDDPKEEAANGGIQPLWRDVMEVHARDPIHVMYGGGDQLYCDDVWKLPSLVQWLSIQDKPSRNQHPFSQFMVNEAFDFYFRYNCQVFAGVFFVARKFYLLFQQHAAEDNYRQLNKGWGLTGLSWTCVMGSTAVIGLDARGERTRDVIIRPASWAAFQDQIARLPAGVRHVVVMATVPLIYPSVPGVEDAMSEPELLDDLLDHWSAEVHKTEKCDVHERPLLVGHAAAAATMAGGASGGAADGSLVFELRVENQTLRERPRPQLDVHNRGSELVLKTPQLLWSYAGYNFWRWDLHVRLGLTPTSIEYAVICSADHFFTAHTRYRFELPAAGQTWHWGFHSCNGFDDPKEEAANGGIQPLWRDVMEVHARDPIHVMYGGGDQLYCDDVWKLPSLVQWLSIQDKPSRNQHPFSQFMVNEAFDFYFRNYTTHFGKEVFADALCSIPQVMVWDDHDIFDGWGSYPPELQNCQVFAGVFFVARKFYLLFQQHAAEDNYRQLNKGWGLTGLSWTRVMGSTAVIGLDARGERTREDIIRPASWAAFQDQIARLPAGVRHVVVMATVPLIYPSVPGVEDAMSEPEILDDLLDHWSAEVHKTEKYCLVRMMQDLAVARALRFTILSGDVHCAGVGYFQTMPKANLKTDPRYMMQIISSAIGNVPPPDAVVKALSASNTPKFVDPVTREKMKPVFENGAVLKAARNWCDVHERPLLVGHAAAAATMAGGVTGGAADGSLVFELRVENQTLRGQRPRPQLYTIEVPTLDLPPGSYSLGPLAMPPLLPQPLMVKFQAELMKAGVGLDAAQPLPSVEGQAPPGGMHVPATSEAATMAADGWGSYPTDLQDCQVFAGVFFVARKFYLLFQQHAAEDNYRQLNKGWGLTGLSWTRVMGSTAVIGLDARGERTRTDIIRPASWAAFQDQIARLPAGVRHVVVMATVPLIYPSVPGVEDAMMALAGTGLMANAMTTFLQKTGLASKIMSQFGEPELLDDLLDHWSAEVHKTEKYCLVRMMQDLAVARALRFTILSGDVHCAGVGYFQTMPKADLKTDPRYMMQVISSAIGNVPPPDAVVKALSASNKPKFIDQVTREEMKPVFENGAVLKAARNWCDVHERPLLVGHAAAAATMAGGASGGAADGSLVFELRVENQTLRERPRPQLYTIEVPTLDLPPGSYSLGPLAKPPPLPQSAELVAAGVGLEAAQPLPSVEGQAPPGGMHVPATSEATTMAAGGTCRRLPRLRTASPQTRTATTRHHTEPGLRTSGAYPQPGAYQVPQQQQQQQQQQQPQGQWPNSFPAPQQQSPPSSYPYPAAGAAPDATQPLVQPQASSSAAAGQQQQQPTPGSPPRGLMRFFSKVTVVPPPSGLCSKAPPSLDEVAKLQSSPLAPSKFDMLNRAPAHPTRVPPPTPMGDVSASALQPAVDPNFSGPPPLEEKFGPYLRFGGYETTTRVYSASVMMVIHQTRSPHPPHLRYRDVHNVGSEVVSKTPRLLWSYAGYNFWRWDLHLQLGLTPTSIEYAVICSADHFFTAHTRYRFELPAVGQKWHWGFHSCNGFHDHKEEIDNGGIQPLWRDVMEVHARDPIHVMYGGGDQLYCDDVWKLPSLMQRIAETPAQAQ
ncbi:hypothetical protein TSOC_003985, partial [Tetrabaena socialis]